MLFSFCYSEDITQAELLFQAMANDDSYNVSKILNTVTWDAETIQELQDAVLDASQLQVCLPHNIENYVSAKNVMKMCTMLGI